MASAVAMAELIGRDKELRSPALWSVARAGIQSARIALSAAGSNASDLLSSACQ
jgi:hypothetical protein